MNTLAYNEPYKLPAGFLTLGVHVLFFVLLYFGVNWRADQPQGMEVDLWSSLPEANTIPVQSEPPAEVKAEAPKAAAPQIAEPPRADISIGAKKKLRVTPKEVEPPRLKSKATDRQTSAEMRELGKQQEQAEQQDRARQAAQGAAIANEVGKYKGLISSRIRRNIVMPPDVADDASAVFVVTLLPDGSVLDVKLRKSSGNSAYDSAVERAIWKAQPMPLPLDEAARKPFINPNQLQLKFSPKDND